MKKIKVLIIDDSALIRKLLSEILSADPQIEVVGKAVDPYDAREKIKKLNPDVITLDIEMPKMDGITFLKNVMRLRPLPVVMISTLTEKGAEITLNALELGAVDYISKPKVSVTENLSALSSDIIAKVKSAARANVQSNAIASSADRVKSSVSTGSKNINKNIKLIAIGASTGGVEATKYLLQTLPDQMPPILIAQHMPASFTTSYAKRLDSLIPQTVTEFVGKERKLEANHVYLANGNEHLCVKAKGSEITAYCLGGEPVNRHKPSVDVLFDTVAETCSKNSIAVLLTGMGVDGAAGLSKVKESGGLTIAQDKDSSVVWGMPRVAIEQGAAMHTLALDKMGSFITGQCYH